MPHDVNIESMTWRVTPDLLAILDANSIFIESNPAWFKTLGWKAEEIRSRPFFDFIHPDDIVATERAYAEIKTGTPVLKFENRYRHKNGTYRWLAWNTVPEGDIFFCSARDVTAAKDTATELAFTEQESEFRDQFMAVLSHDLRNPLAAITTSLRVALEEEQSERAGKYLVMAQDSAIRMTELIENVTDFARARFGGDIGLDPQDGIQLEPLLRRTVQENRLVVDDANIAELYACPKPMRCDPDRIKQLVSNLVANALFHGSKDFPIGVEATQRNGVFTLSVINSGAPIPERTQAMLFQPFVRAEFRASQNGLGLGLYIAHQIAEAHGGSLTFTSGEQATEFRFEMPIG